MMKRQMQDELLKHQIRLQNSKVLFQLGSQTRVPDVANEF